MAEIPVKIEKICSRLQTLLDQWIDSVPIISEASASTLISQFNLYSTVMKDYPKKEEWALHDMPYLLMQTVSQIDPAWNCQCHSFDLHLFGSRVIIDESDF